MTEECRLRRFYMDILSFQFSKSATRFVAQINFILQDTKMASEDFEIAPACCGGGDMAPLPVAMVPVASFQKSTRPLTGVVEVGDLVLLTGFAVLSPRNNYDCVDWNHQRADTRSWGIWRFTYRSRPRTRTRRRPSSQSTIS